MKVISTHFSSSSVRSLANHTYGWHGAPLLRTNVVLPKIRQSPSFFFLPSLYNCILLKNQTYGTVTWNWNLNLPVVQPHPNNSSWLSYAPLSRTEGTDRGPYFSQAAFFSTIFLCPFSLSPHCSDIVCPRREAKKPCCIQPRHTCNIAKVGDKAMCWT